MGLKDFYRFGFSDTEFDYLKLIPAPDPEDKHKPDYGGEPDFEFKWHLRVQFAAIWTDFESDDR